MPETLVAQNIAGIGGIRLLVSDGNVTGLTMEVEINYGTFGVNRTLDLWPSLAVPEKAALQGLYAKAVQVATQTFIA